MKGIKLLLSSAYFWIMLLALAGALMVSIGAFFIAGKGAGLISGGIFCLVFMLMLLQGNIGD